MNYIGKIFVFAVFIMSLVLMTFAGAIYVSHTNWEAEIERKPEECVAGQRPGYRHLLSEAEKERDSLQKEITRLTESVADEEQKRDQVVAKLQSALAEKHGELEELRKEKAERHETIVTKLQEQKDLQAELTKATEELERLRKEVAGHQATVDTQVKNSVRLASELEETKAFLAVAEERRAQLEKQAENARRLLQQSGLTLDSLPKDRVPVLDGDVVAVADDAIQISLGGDDGLQVGHAIEVYRSGQYIGRAVVRAVKPDHSIAVIVKQFARGVVQRGDKVTTKLKA